MKVGLLLLTGLLATVPAGAKPRVAILNAQQAILSTEDGKAAAARVKSQFGAEADRLSGEQREIESLQRRLENGSGLTGEEAGDLKNRIAGLAATHRRNEQDFQRRVQEEERRVLQDLNAKMVVIVEQYARKKHFEVVLDESDPKTPVYWRAGNTDITKEIVRRYDQAARK